MAKPNGKVHAFSSAYAAARRIRRWRSWREVGVRFSSFHVPKTPFALPFDPNDYLWAGPVTLTLREKGEFERDSFRLGHYRRGVRKYLSLLARGKKIDPVVLLYHEAWGWTLQDGNHRYEALVRHGAKTYEAFLAKPKRPQPIDRF
jgi:hypothetical protein